MKQLPPLLLICLLAACEPKTKLVTTTRWLLTTTDSAYLQQKDDHLVRPAEYLSLSSDGTCEGNAWLFFHAYHHSNDSCRCLFLTNNLNGTWRYNDKQNVILLSCDEQVYSKSLIVLHRDSSTITFRAILPNASLDSATFVLSRDSFFSQRIVVGK